MIGIEEAQLRYNRIESHLLTRKVIGYFPLKVGHRLRQGDVKRLTFRGNNVQVYVPVKPEEYRQRGAGCWRPVYEPFLG